MEEQQTEIPDSALKFQASQFVGIWCFYKQEGFGEMIKESVTIKLNKDKNYSWNDSGIYNEYNLTWDQEGTWQVEDDTLSMTEVGSHRIVKIENNLIILKRLSTMFLKKGYC